MEGEEELQDRACGEQPSPHRGQRAEGTIPTRAGTIPRGRDTAWAPLEGRRPAGSIPRVHGEQPALQVTGPRGPSPRGRGAAPLARALTLHLGAIPARGEQVLARFAT